MQFDDANKLLHPNDSLKGIEEANKQNAFVFLNHQVGLHREVMELPN